MELASSGQGWRAPAVAEGDAGWPRHASPATKNDPKGAALPPVRARDEARAHASLGFTRTDPVPRARQRLSDIHAVLLPPVLPRLVCLLSTEAQHRPQTLARAPPDRCSPYSFTMPPVPPQRARDRELGGPARS